MQQVVYVWPQPTHIYSLETSGTKSVQPTSSVRMMAQVKDQAVPLPKPPAAGQLDRLQSFRCLAGGRYNLPDQWYYQDQYGNKCLDMCKALEKYDEFVQAVRENPIPAPYAHDYDIDISALQHSFGRAANERKGKFTFDQHKYKFVGPPETLDDNGQLHEQLAKSRVIFTPSKGRCSIGLLRWDSEQLHQTLGILVVPHDELKEYSRMWGARRLVIGVHHDCIGAARYHIIQLARHWKLDEFWMIDDSVPTSHFYQINKDNWSLHNPISFLEVLNTIELMSLKVCFRNAVLIGVTSTKSVEHLKPHSPRHITNVRAPTSCVFVCLKCMPNTLNYDHQLPSKEDIILAAQLIAAGTDVVIDRYIHFKDYPFTEGGCADSKLMKEPWN